MRGVGAKRDIRVCVIFVVFVLWAGMVWVAPSQGTIETTSYVHVRVVVRVIS